ncbi:MAG: RHS repeat-associated core domain-containing protein, partial [Kiritimatiellia bacterium]|nr:RHS repeat-associated core domain-containing protein [Kiritimatiellia bacterium]
STTPPPAGQASTISTTLFSYNDLGEQVHTALDLNDNGQIDLDTDRVQSSYTSYWSDPSDHYWRVSTSVIYPEDNSATPLTNSISRTRLTGLGTTSALGLLTSENVSIDILGNATISQTWTDRDAKKVTQVTAIPTSTEPAVQVTVNGVTVSSESPTGVAMTYSYDALGRQIQALRSGDRPIAQTTAYDSVGRVAWVEDAASNRTAFAYDSVGRRIAVTNALGQVTHTAYDLEDRVIATWGATYPVAYEFDAFGRMTAMYTLRDNAVVIDGYSSFQSQISSFDKTQWLYDQPTGLLTNKLHSDGKGPSYTYTADGKLETRNWERGVTTTYSYDTCCAAGSLKSVTYSDGTPGFTNTVDRLGRVVTVTDAQGSRTNIYDAATLALIEEHLHDGTVLTRTHDNFGRASGLTVAGVGDPGDPPYAISYAHDPLGRFDQAIATDGAFTATNTYAYLSGSGLSAGWTAGPLTISRAYETNRDLLTQVKSEAGTNIVSQFDYQNDALGRRTLRNDSGSAFGLAVTNEFGYNIRSEMISAMMNSNQFGYAFDPIGNRQWASDNAITNFYAANELNQYTNVQNGTQWTPICDYDGNSTTHREWTLTWDGENRLIRAESEETAVEYVYDFMSRRVARVEYEWDTDHWELKSDTRFAYDGWALIRELTDAGSGVSTNHYYYGPDISGSMQGAGTIGGLWLRTGAEGPLYYTYDGNGNVSEIVDPSGTVRGHYEFDPFGIITVQSGDLADTNPIRFSTKRQDEATGFLYYGYRDLDTVWGRWLSRDPIGERGGLNLLVAFLNNAIGSYDPLGNSSNLDTVDNIIEIIDVLKEAKDAYDKTSALGENVALILEAIDGNSDAQAQLIEKGIDEVMSSVVTSLGLPSGASQVLQASAGMGYVIGDAALQLGINIECRNVCNSCITCLSNDDGRYAAPHVGSLRGTRGKEADCIKRGNAIYGKCRIRNPTRKGIGSDIVDSIRGTYWTIIWVK